MSPEAVTVISGDTDVTPDTGASAGSRVIYTEGNAVKESVARLKQALLTTASEMLKLSYESLDLRDGLTFCGDLFGRREVGFGWVIGAVTLAKRAMLG